MSDQIIAQPIGDPDPSGLTHPGELHLDLGVTRPTAPAPLGPGDDKMKNDFLAGRALAQRGDPVAELNARFGIKPAPSAPPALEKAAPGAVEGAAPAVTPQPANPALSVMLPPALASRLSNSSPGDMLMNVVHGAAAVGKDVALGTFDAPRQIVGGALDFGNNLMRFADDVTKKAEDAGMPNVYFQLLDKGGKWAPSMMSADEFRQAQSEGKDDVFQLPTTGSPDTVTGNIVRTGTTFMLGRGSSGGALAGATGALPVAGEAVRDFISGAVGQNPNQPRLSNIIDQVMPNFVTDFLKAKDPGEEDALFSRLKSGLEYAGLGLAIEGVKKSVTWLKGLKGEGATHPLLEPGTPTETPGQPIMTQGSAKPTTTGPVRDVLSLGNPIEPIINTPPVTQEVAKQAETYLEGMGGDNPIKLNLSRIGSAEDVKMALRQVSSMLPAEEVQSNRATIALADALGKTPDEYLSGVVRGGSLNAQESVAARMMLDSSAQQLIDYAKAAVDPSTATPEAKAMFLRAFSTHRAIQQYVEGARTEAGRTLQSWNIMSRQSSNMSQAISNLVDAADNTGDLTSMAQKIADTGDAVRAGRLVAQSFGASFREGFMKTFYNVLLSNPKTVVKKLASDAGQAMWNLATTYSAENFGSGAVPQGETSALFWGYMNSFKDAVRMAGKGLKSGESQFYNEFQSMDAVGKYRISMLANATPEALATEDAGAGAVQYLKGALPTSWIGAADDFAKYWNYRAEIGRLAYRSIAQSGLEPGSEEFATKLAQTLDNVPFGIHQEALTNTLKTTFQEPLSGLARTVQQLADKINLPLPHTDVQIPLGRILLPFVKIPANIARWSYYNSPLAAAFPNSTIKAEMAAGGATRDLAIAKIGLGSVVSLSVADMALNNVITGKGPTDPQLQRAWRAAGNEPYSIQLSKLGGPFKDAPPIGYNQIEPFGQLASTIADSFGIMKFAKDDGRDNVAASLIFGVGNAMLSKTYMQGVADFFEAMNSPERDGQKFIDNLITSLTIPQGVKGMAKGFDEWQRAHYGLMDGIESYLPGASKNLPPQTNLWGDPVPQRDGYLPFITEGGTLMGGKTQDVTRALGRAISPVPLGRRTPVEPIDQWIWENRNDFPRGSSNYLGITAPGQVQSFASANNRISAQIELTPQELYRFKVLAGQELKETKTQMGARDYLNALVQGQNPDASVQNEWNKSSDGERALMVQAAINKFRTAAKAQLPQEFPELKSALMAGWQMRASQLQSAPTETPALTPRANAQVPHVVP